MFKATLFIVEKLYNSPDVLPLVNVWTNPDIFHTWNPHIPYVEYHTPLKKEELLNTSNNLNGPQKIILSERKVNLKMFYTVLSPYITFLNGKYIKMENLLVIARGQVECVCVSSGAVDTNRKR